MRHIAKLRGGLCLPVATLDAVLLFSVIVGPAPADCPIDPTVNVPLCTASLSQYTPTIVSDGAGGAIVTWSDQRGASANGDIYAQRVNAAGASQWAANGVALCTAAHDQAVPTIVSDGGGGAIVTWHDYRAGSPNGDIYAQRVNAAGVPQWTANGVALCTDAGLQVSPTIASDGAGGW